VTLAHALAGSSACAQRIQFTSDLLPADIIGVSIRSPERSFHFHPGPIFTQMILADEVNRATPKPRARCWRRWRAQSPPGETRPLPEPFFVIATQNPYQVGTFPLPESQLDRFLMCLKLGYPSRVPNACCWKAAIGAT
jgi:MoxR-like ATPase